jgi:hypothetical protein
VDLQPRALAELGPEQLPAPALSDLPIQMTPLNRYDKYFGGVRGSAEKAHASMVRTYGRKDGETVFYATIAKRKHKTASARRKRWGFG